MPKAFEKAEFDARLARVRQSMTEAGLDAICTSNPANIESPLTAHRPSQPPLPNSASCGCRATPGPCSKP